MKIGIITYWSSEDNYGQQLQCFALQRYLRNLGHDAFLIRYIYTYKASILTKILSRFSVSFWKNRTKRHEEFKLYRVNHILNQKRKFKEFRQEYLQMSNELYTNIRQLQQNPPKADLYITGSDQVWHNPIHDRNAEAFYLNFGPKNIKRMSYAASIGRKIAPNEARKFKSLVNKLDYISVRELDAEKTCHDLGIEKAVVTIDPTFLLPLQEYTKLYNKQDIVYPSYIFLYLINIDSLESICWSNITKYAKEENLQIQHVMSSGYLPARELIPDSKNIQASIPEWLTLINNASCIITTSFHAVVFAILHHKQFLAIPLKGVYAKANNRIITLLESLNLSERIYNESLSFAQQMNNPINWNLVESKLSEIRISSINFLNQCLDNQEQ